MKLFLISQDEVDGYDTFDSAVVCASGAEAAASIDPTPSRWNVEPWTTGAWCSGPEKVTVKFIGEAAEGMQEGVICASFNAG